MELKLSFLGAARNVTGSRHYLQANGTDIMVDCGLYQERQFADRNWDAFPKPANSIDALLLTHAHLDHCGLIPKLVKEGFKGRIYCTSATAEIAKIILLDAGKLQEEDASYKKKRHMKEGKITSRPVVPLYTKEDAEACFDLFTPVPYRKVVPLGDGIEATFYDAGHVLGSSIIRVKVRNADDERIIIFSGDIGRSDSPMVCDPTVFDKADYVLIESTYGDRVHGPQEDVQGLIGQAINETCKAGGRLMVPSFALERSQELLYYINQLQIDGVIPTLKIFLDSPMASRITEVFRRHSEIFDPEMKQLIRQHHSPLNLSNLHLAGSSRESKAINDIKGPVIIIAGSGMCTGGRIKHHLANGISNPANTLMFVGYQAAGTLGRRLVEGEKEIRILGQMYPVNAKVTRIHGFSAHADRDELLGWLKALKAPPRKVFVVHGETKSAQAFGKYAAEQTGWDVVVPEYQDEITLD
jgi:metallo-beta-lactamase family protein